MLTACCARARYKRRHLHPEAKWINRDGIRLKDVNIKTRPLEEAAMGPVHVATACAVVNGTGPGRGDRLDHDWPRRCLYSRLLRSFLRDGPGPELVSRRDWLSTYVHTHSCLYASS